MKVRELIEALESQDPEADVAVVYDYGDHWHTQVAPTIKAIEEGYTVPSDYHGMPRLVVDDEEFVNANRVIALFT